MAEYKKELPIGKSSRTVIFEERMMTFSRPVFSKDLISGRTATYELLYSDIISVKRSFGGITIRCGDGRSYSLHGKGVKDAVGMFAEVLRENEKKI